MFEAMMFWTGILAWVLAAAAGALWAACASFEWWLTKMQFGRAFLEWRWQQLQAGRRNGDGS